MGVEIGVRPTVSLTYSCMWMAVYARQAEHLRPGRHRRRARRSRSGRLGRPAQNRSGRPARNGGAARAFTASSGPWPTSAISRHPGRTVINLAPADLRKDAGGFDLPIALGMLVATGQLLAGTTARLCHRRRTGPGRQRPAGQGRLVDGDVRRATQASPSCSCRPPTPAKRPSSEGRGLRRRQPGRGGRHPVRAAAGRAGRRPTSKNCSPSSTPTTSTSPTCAARSSPSAPWWSRPAAAITS